MLWIFSIAFQHDGKRGAQSAGIPADGGRATPPCGSLGACPADADNEAAIAVTQHGTSSILKKRFNCPSIRKYVLRSRFASHGNYSAGDRRVGVLDDD